MSPMKWYRASAPYLWCLILASCDWQPTGPDRVAPASPDPRANGVTAPRPNAQASALSNVIATECPPAATRWLNPVNGNWLDATRWSAGIPTATTPACIDLPGSYVVTIGAAFGATVVPAQSVFVGDPGAAAQPTLLLDQGTLTVGTDITVHGRLELAQRTGLGVGATALASGTIAVATTGTLTTSNTGGNIEAATIENYGTVSAGTATAGAGFRGPFVNRGTLTVPLGRAMTFRGPTSGGPASLTLEAGSVNVLGTLNHMDGSFTVRGGTVSGEIDFFGADELHLEHDAGGRYNLNAIATTVPTTITKLNGTIGASQHVWMGVRHITVTTTTGLTNQGQLTVEHNGGFGTTGTVLLAEPGATLVNEGTITLVSFANSGAQLAGAITNEPGGVILTTGGGTPNISPNPLINRGTLRAASGQLRIVAGAALTAPEVILENGTVESAVGRYQQTAGSLTVRGGVVTGQLDLIAMSELVLEHDGGGRFNLLALGGLVPTTISKLSGVVGL